MNASQKKRRRASLPALTYAETRDREQLAVHERAIEDFVKEYKRPRPPSPARPRQTLFFFPGGMACQLCRSKEKFEDGVAGQQFDYSLEWLTCGTFLGGALQLGMFRDGSGVLRDADSHIVIADGAVNLFGLTPHDGLIEWCKDNNIDLFVFNWDWRRRMEDAARFFVDRFWPVFRDKVGKAGIGEAAETFSLVGHSFGGMIVNLILRGNDADVSRKMARAITVATPFYGYASQAHRWFEGEHLLNGPLSAFRKGMTKVICSLPGLYVLHYLDFDVTYARDRNALATDQHQHPAYPLNSYPSVDARSGDFDDPWRQQTNAGNKVRYPENLGFQQDELSHALQISRHMASPMDPGMSPRFFNLRGVQLSADHQGARNETVGGVTVDWIDPDFDPRDDSPIVDAALVPGDGTQPAWTARLATNDPSRCRTVAGKDVHHMFLMSHARTLNQLASILCAEGARVARPKPAPALATDGEINDFLEWLHKYQDSGKPPTLKEVRRAWPLELLTKIASRIIEDILKRRAPSSRKSRKK